MVSFGKKRVRSLNHHRAATCLYWVGVTMSALCVVAALGHDSQLVTRFEERYLPPSGAFAAIAALAFLATELAESLSHAGKKDRERPIEMPLNSRVSKGEFISAVAAEFDRLDQEKRGVLDIQQLNQAMHTADWSSRLKSKDF